MIILLSPAKTLDESPAPRDLPATQPALLAEAEKLIIHLRKLKEKDIAELMDLSPKLAALNHSRYAAFHTPFTVKNAKQALLMFKGDVYTGFDLPNYTAKDYDFAQTHVRILSGLYGLLRPLDLIQPYRLEMGTALKVGRAKNLYEYWRGQLTAEINTAKPDVVVNLASSEYFRAVQMNALSAPLITPVFKEKKGNQLKIIGLFAKRARGLMTDYAVRNSITKPEKLKNFSAEGYGFDPDLSHETEWVFVR